MRINWRLMLTLITAAFLTSACATSAEWSAWRAHPTHFASADHMAFSLRNRDGDSPQVTRRDVAEARTQAWWGDPVVASSAQIASGR